ncbi:UNVERIFIED_CONTAM: hypothetical protein Slati_0902400 [Sesamum latifolium]|uniref:Uncharacterized protein n=1 Tax=Sesamum latifolium TaxID=2727402 RepID=A0AAW2XNJ0_9LAMI
MTIQNPSRVLYSNLMVVWSLRRVPSRIPQQIPLRKQNTSQLRKLRRRRFWMKNYIQELGVVPSIAELVVIFCDNNGAIAQAKEPRSHHRSKHILRRYHLLREMVSRGDCRMDRVNSAENTTDPLTKPMSQVAQTQHLDKMDLRSIGD